MKYTRKSGKSKYKYLNLALAYDIETTSYTNKNGKGVCIYSHCISVDGREYIFRRTENFVRFLDKLVKKYIKNDDEKIVIYVHNLSYEFNFMKSYLNFKSVFANGSKRNILTATTENNIEFRCSYALSNMSLSSLGKKMGVEKLKDFDYNKIRTHKTTLTAEEKQYILQDVRIIIKYINNLMQYNSIARMPLTATGFVRKNIKRNTINKSKEYKYLIKKLTIEPLEMDMLNDCFCGGLTRANVNFAGKIIKNVIGFDISSSYPASLFCNKFPISKGKKVKIKNIKHFEQLSKSHAILSTITIKNVVNVRDYTTLSFNKVEALGEYVLDNGRILNAEKLIVTVNEIDYKMLKEHYLFDVEKIGSTYVYEKDYLPKELIEVMMGYYESKTTLKNIEDKIEDYNRAKEHLNSIYGVMVTNPIRPDYDNENGNIQTKVLTDEIAKEKLDKYNKDFSRFIFFNWGVWCTSYSRLALLKLNWKLEDAGVNDYYCDTDSRYFDNNKEALDIVKEINNDIINEMKKAEKHFGIKSCYKNSEGKDVQLGVWTLDKKYDTFKTLGAKRYAGYIDGKLHITISGLSKDAADFIHANGGLDYFTNHMIIPSEHSGRLIHTYIDVEKQAVLKDVYGKETFVKCGSGVHLEKSNFNMNMHDDYIRLISIIKDKYQSLK